MDELTKLYTDPFGYFIARRGCYKNYKLKFEPKELI